MEVRTRMSLLISKLQNLKGKAPRQDRSFICAYDDLATYDEQKYNTISVKYTSTESQILTGFVQQRIGKSYLTTTYFTMEHPTLTKRN